MKATKQHMPIVNRYPDFKVDIPNWKESLKECINKLKQ